ncbi:MAG: cytochrome C oxidase subunit IV family protein [Ilumatobacteraceae bacterium]
MSTITTDSHHDVADDAPHDGHGLTDLGYIKVALALALITAIEVTISYMVDDLGALFLPLLIGLMIIKFFSVVLYFMHLKFDNRLFSLLFYLGLFLAVAVFVAALFTFRFFSS